MVRVTAKRDSRWRAGMPFTREPVLLSPDEVSPKQLIELAEDDCLLVELSTDGETFAALD
jgi:hypothetical protein